MNIAVAEILRLVKLKIEPVAQEEALQQARLLVSAVLGIEPAALGLHAWAETTHEQAEIIGELTQRRANGEPLQYILGEWTFMDLPFYTDERALIPRQDTELLCETAIRLIQERGYRNMLDLCTGSGCVAITVRKRTGADVTASDISEDALALAKENCELNETEVSLIRSDLFDEINGAFDLITCNPPYISAEEMESLQPEIAFEPRLALYGGQDGLDFFRRIAREFANHLNNGGTLLLEIGSTQGARVTELFYGYDTEVRNDLAGNPRVVVVSKQRN